MKAPINLRDTETWRQKSRWISPDREWLVDQYETQGKFVNEIADDLSASWYTVAIWLEAEGLKIRGDRLGKNNPAWRGGRTRNYGRDLLRRSGGSVECSWCRAKSKKAYDMHLHHKDHNKHNNTLENLCWLCGACHRLETALWNLLKLDKIDLACEDRTMVVTFK